MRIYVAIGWAFIWILWMPLKFWCRQKGRGKLQTLFKMVSTLFCASVALWACLAGGDTVSWLLLAGLVMGIAADGVLEYRFKAGGVLFFLAHVLYVAAFVTLCPPMWQCALVFVPMLLFAAWFLSRYKLRFADPTMHVCLLLYAVALSALLAASIPAAFAVGSPRLILAAIGAALFVMSDATLCRNTIEHRLARSHEALAGRVDARAEKRRNLEEYLSLGCYYTAQTLLALCAWASA